MLRQLWIRTAYDNSQDIPLPRDMRNMAGSSYFVFLKAFTVVWLVPQSERVSA
jgi:hypothetical protein